MFDLTQDLGGSIDCPEKGQAFGNRARQAASALVFGKEVTLKTYGVDKIGRTIADVFLPDGTNVIHELVKDGWCWWYRKYAPGNSELEKLEKDAREAGHKPKSRKALRSRVQSRMLPQA